ncbi:MAG: GNAT family N-acetyltransferase [Actinomycetota bacterium]|nr:GNAT family N-acetyltransferase [Actinomycetota bacterium]
MTTIETERLLLEPWHERWLEEYVQVAADPEVMRYIGAGVPWNRKESERSFARSLEHWQRHGFGKRSLVEKATGAWLGFVELAHVGPEAIEVSPGEVEIGWWLTRSAWGRGFATEGAIALRDEGFERVGLDRVIGRFQPENAASGRIMEKLGMRFERDAIGRHGGPIRIYALSRAGWLERPRIA